MSDLSTLHVGGAAPYDVMVGTGLLGELPAMLGPGVQRVAVIHPRALAATGEAIREDLAEQGYDAHGIEIPDAEEAKLAPVASFCWQVLGQTGFTRTDAVVSVGGGATTDLAGFVAATWLRGVRVVHMPTTLLGMVDAAVGGKTGINTAEGKNLVGAFHAPAGVLCDLATLETLPRNELVSGLAEVIKCGFIADPVILDLVEQDPEAATHRRHRRAARADRALARGQDRRRRRRPQGDRWRRRPPRPRDPQLRPHPRPRDRAGRALQVAPRRGGVDRHDVRRRARPAGRPARRGDRRAAPVHPGPRRAPDHLRRRAWGQLLEAMKVDKKTRGDQLRFVVLDGLAKPAVLQGPDPALLTAAFAEISR